MKWWDLDFLEGSNSHIEATLLETIAFYKANLKKCKKAMNTYRFDRLVTRNKTIVFHTKNSSMQMLCLLNSSHSQHPAIGIKIIHESLIYRGSTPWSSSFGSKWSKDSTILRHLHSKLFPQKCAMGISWNLWASQICRKSLYVEVQQLSKYSTFLCETSPYALHSIMMKSNKDIVILSKSYERDYPLCFSISETKDVGVHH